MSDESSLTGEALPVAKTCISNDNTPFSLKTRGKRNCLFAGCTVLETQPDPGEKVVALVLATGALTSKGKLIRDMLYPLPIMFVFLEHLKIVFPILFVWGVVMLVLSIIILDAADIDSWFYGMFTISQILSPLLPAVLVMGQSISASRLAKKGIMCVDLQRTTLAGKVKVFCFDKTGTLTKEGLEYIGAVNAESLSKIQPDFSLLKGQMKYAMQSCHSLSMVDGKFVGNFVDIEMFRATKSSLDSTTPSIVIPHSNGSTLKILKRFEFIHSHAYMSVVCQDMNTNKTYVFLKGSAEKIVELADCPSGFLSAASKYSRDGCYIVAVAYKELSTTNDIHDLSRAEIESGCSLSGMLLFRNELKSDTKSALEELRNGGTRLVMITGDHPMTAVHIGIESGMIPSGIEIIFSDVVEEEVLFTNLSTNEQFNINRAERILETYGNIELVVTGAAFRALNRKMWLQSRLQDCRIFARMSPDEKQECVQMHMKDYITGMCGDGGNDAGALKTAHTGIALSDQESQVVAHFSSSNRSIYSCVELLRECRCSLDTSFAAYKYLLIYGHTTAIVGLIQYAFKVNMSQATWIFIDGSTVPISWALTNAQPAKQLIGARPTARLLGAETIFSVLGPITLNLLVILFVVLIIQPAGFYKCNPFDGSHVDLRKWWELADNYIGSITAILTMYQMIHAALAYNIGSKYRQGGFKNLIFMAIYAFFFLLISLILLLDPNSLGCTFRINCGTPAALQSLGYNVPYNAPEKFYSKTGHNVSFNTLIL